MFPLDLDTFLEFYTKVLRFSVDRDERHTETPYVYLHRGAARIGAVPSWSPPSLEHRMPPTGVEIVLEVDDLEAERDAIVSLGWPLEEDVVDRPWGLRDFRLRDPDGYYLRFTTP
jgi:catechol 2,3-dioxygenase-like lactoylglutathione lyase family enzyme